MTTRRATSSQIGDALGLAPSTVQMYARDRKIPFETTPGGHYRFDLDEVRVALTAAKGRKSSSAERQEVAAAFGVSRRGRAQAELRAVRTSAVDVGASLGSGRRAGADNMTSPEPRSAAVLLLAGATEVLLSAAAR